VKHWVGNGAAENGWDGHNVQGKNAVFRTNNLQQHIEPFIGAFEAWVSRRAADVFNTPGRE